MLKCILFLWVGLATALASPLYQIRFDGTIQNPSLATTFDTSGQSVSRNLNGLTVHGSIDIDLGLLPPIASVGSFSFGVSSTALSPLFLVNVSISIDNMLPFSNSIQFNTGPYPIVPDTAPPAATANSNSGTSQLVSLNPVLGFLLVSLNAQSDWRNDVYSSVFTDLGLNLQLLGLPGLPYDPATGQFQPFSGAPTSSSGSSFHYNRTLNSTDKSQGFKGFVENTAVSGNIVITQVSGDFLPAESPVPEPTTFGLTALAAGLMLRRARRS